MYFFVFPADVPNASSNDPSIKRESFEGEVTKDSVLSELQKSLFRDVVNVSDGFLQRTAYKKKVNASKLDGLLERRVKQFTMEEKQRLEKLKQTSVSKPSTENKETTFAAEEQKVKIEGSIPETPKTSRTDGVAGLTIQDKDPVVKKLYFNQEEEQSGTNTSGQNNNLDVRLSDSGVTKEHQKSPEPEPKTVSRVAMSELNGNSQSLDPSLNLNVKTDKTVLAGVCPTPENTGTIVENNENNLNIKKPVSLQVNGKDGLVDSQCENLTENVNAKELPSSIGEEIKAILPKEPVKSLTNGDATQECLKEWTNSSNPQGKSDAEKGVANTDPDYLPPQKMLKLENTSQGTVDTSVSSTVSEPSSVASEPNSRPEVPSCNSESMQVEETKPLVSSPIQSAEESSLSSDITENSNSVGEITTVVTQVTTTTTTVSTESCTMLTSSASLASNNGLSTSVSTDCKTSSSTLAMLSTQTMTTVTKVTNSSQEALVTKECKTVVTETRTGTRSGPSGSSVTSMTVSHEYSTRDRVQLLKFSRTKKARSGTALPSYRKFVTKSSKKSIFVLPNDELKKLARRGGIREVPIFNYNAKPALDIWPYPSPRPTFGITWR